MTITEEQRKALEEGRIVPVEIRIDLSLCSLDPAAFPGGGEASGGDHHPDRAGRD